MKEADLFFCKDCIFFTRLELKVDGSYDMRYKKNLVCVVQMRQRRG
jgi:hypothetical protein